MQKVIYTWFTKKRHHPKLFTTDIKRFGAILKCELCQEHVVVTCFKDDPPTPAQCRLVALKKQGITIKTEKTKNGYVTYALKQS